MSGRTQRPARSLALFVSQRPPLLAAYREAAERGESPPRGGGALKRPTCEVQPGADSSRIWVVARRYTSQVHLRHTRLHGAHQVGELTASRRRGRAAAGRVEDAPDGEEPEKRPPS